MSHGCDTRSQTADIIHWVFYHPDRPDHFSAVFTPDFCRIQKEDLNEIVADWIQPAFADRIRKRYNFDLNEDSIQILKPNTAVDLFSVNKKWAKSITNFDDDFQLMPVGWRVKELLTFLHEDRQPNHLHLVVIAEAAARAGTRDKAENKDKVGDIKKTYYSRYETTLTTNTKPPSSAPEYWRAQAHPTTAIYDGRNEHGDGSTVAPPIQIFHPIFETLTYYINDPNTQPPISFIRETRELMQFVATIASIDSNKVKDLCNKLSSLIGHFCGYSNDRTSADGIGYVDIDIDGFAAPACIMEVDHEYGETGYDPATQASFSFQRHWKTSGATRMRQRCCCPTFILVAGGPWFCILGGVFTDKFVVQRLTDLMWTALSSMYEDARVQKIVRTLYALKLCLHELKAYYTMVKDLPVQDSPPESNAEPLNPSRFFPYTASFTGVDSASGQEREWKFKYLDSLEDCSACVTYQAEIIDEPRCGEKIVVKFVTRYGEEVHRFLEQSGHAPKLYYLGPLRDGGKNSSGNIWPNATIPHPGLHLGPLRMAVMEYIHPSRTPHDSGKQVSDVIKELHENGFVFGDLREPNVLFDASGKAKFIDFDWAGRYKRDSSTEDNTHPFARYPLALSRSLNWARPAKELELNFIQPEDDVAMLKIHFKGPY